MNEDKKLKIINYIKNKGPISAGELSGILSIGRAMTHRHLKSLVQQGFLTKQGKPPKVFYIINNFHKEDKIIGINESLIKIIDNNFLIITPSGEKKEGFDGFKYWCQKQNLPIEKTAEEYSKTIKKYSAYKKEGFINGMYKIKKTFNKVYLDKLYYLDFYSIERFGKTKLGQLLLYAKQSQDKTLIKNLVDQIKPKILEIVKKYKIDAIGFIPPTVKREVQLMKEIEKNLNLSLPTISLVKIKTEISVPQKTLSKLEDRVENAEKTIVVNEKKSYKIILLIDDALGSGSTLNEVAKKIKSQKITQNIMGLAITGSFSGFEIISEV